ncbi:MAG: hypothetical protein AB8U25_06185 [Rickettsiales endosymbiont of Dermacentor nuttalli]
MPDLMIDTKNHAFLINDKDTTLLFCKNMAKYTRYMVNYIGKKDQKRVLHAIICSPALCARPL